MPLLTVRERYGLRDLRGRKGTAVRIRHKVAAALAVLALGSIVAACAPPKPPPPPPGGELPPPSPDQGPPANSPTLTTTANFVTA